MVHIISKFPVVYIYQITDYFVNEMTQAKTSLVIIGLVAAALTLIVSPSLATVAFAQPPKVTTTTDSTTSTSPVNGGLKKSTTTTITTTTTCANNGGQGPQAANCPDGHGSTTISDPVTVCNGVSNKAGKGSPVGPSPC
jgi:hypothetical protein